MCGRISFEEENRKETELWVKICKYLLWVTMIGIAAFLASRALHAEGKEASARAEEGGMQSEEYSAVVQEALMSQMRLMEYAGVDRKEQRLYEMQLHRLAFFKDTEKEDTGFYWCKELNALTMEAYEKLDDEGKQLLTDCQMNRERWKEAGNKKNQEKGQEICELINRFYYTQLKCVLNQECA